MNFVKLDDILARSYDQMLRKIKVIIELAKNLVIHQYRKAKPLRKTNKKHAPFLSQFLQKSQKWN